LHPYIDRIDSDSWLDAEVTGEGGAILRYFVRIPPSWDSVLAARVRHHFDLLSLGRVYRVQANRTLASIRHSLRAQLQSGGEECVRTYLHDAAETRLLDRLNGWEGVAYRAWATDRSFCQGAFMN
jgi:hypothetical protein